MTIRHLCLLSGTAALCEKQFSFHRPMCSFSHDKAPLVSHGLFDLCFDCGDQSPCKEHDNSKNSLTKAAHECDRTIQTRLIDNVIPAINRTFCLICTIVVRDTIVCFPVDFALRVSVWIILQPSFDHADAMFV